MSLCFRKSEFISPPVSPSLVLKYQCSAAAPISRSQPTTSANNSAALTRNLRRSLELEVDELRSIEHTGCKYQNGERHVAGPSNRHLVGGQCLIEPRSPGPAIHTEHE